MFEGVNASDGIGIGVARVAVDPDLSFTPHVPEDADAEKARYLRVGDPDQTAFNHDIYRAVGRGRALKQAAISAAFCEPVTP